MSIIEKINSIPIDQRLKIADGIRKNFPTSTDVDGTVLIDYSQEFDQLNLQYHIHDKKLSHKRWWMQR